MLTTRRAASLSVAPMMGRSHGAARRLWRMLCPDVLLYTEMVPSAAFVNGVSSRHARDLRQDPVALQLAGGDPGILAIAARAGAEHGYSEINLNCGCPSSRATAGGFGACMMLRPDHVERCVSAMRAASDVPVSVKCRISVDGADPAKCLFAFASRMADAGCGKMVVHARTALLRGVNPKQNRNRPPLDPGIVVELKRNFKDIEVISNGGISSVADATRRAVGVDGVMLGRAVVSRPSLLREFAETWYARSAPNLAEVASAYLGFASARLACGDSPHLLLAPLAGLVAGMPDARRFRQALHQAISTGDIGMVMACWP